MPFNPEQLSSAGSVLAILQMGKWRWRVRGLSHSASARNSSWYVAELGCEPSTEPTVLARASSLRLLGERRLLRPASHGDVSRYRDIRIKTKTLAMACYHSLTSRLHLDSNSVSLLPAPGLIMAHHRRPAHCWG